MIEKFEKFNESNYNPENWGEKSGSGWNTKYPNHPFVGKKIEEICKNYNPDLCDGFPSSLVIKNVSIRQKTAPCGYLGYVSFKGGGGLTFFADNDSEIKFLTQDNGGMFIPDKEIFIAIEGGGGGGTGITVWDLKTGLVIDQTNYDP
jgi:hypothetical protein